MTKQAKQTESANVSMGVEIIGSRSVSIGKLYLPKSFYVQDLDLETVESYKDAYRMNKYVQAIEVSPVVVNKEARFQVINGRHRAYALIELHKEDLISDEVLVTELNGTRAELLVRAIQTNRNNKVTSLQLAMAYQRLSNMGISQTDIAKALEVTGAEVSNYLLLAELPEQLKTMIINGDVSATFAYEKVRRYGYDSAYLMAKEEARAKTAKELGKRMKVPMSLSAVTPLTKKVALQPKKMKKLTELLSALSVNLDDVHADVEIEMSPADATQLLALSNELNEINEHNKSVDEFMSMILSKEENREAA